MVPDIVTLVVLVVTNEAMSPTPDVPRPIAALVLLQLYTVPATLPVNVTPVVVEPLQITWLLILLTFDYSAINTARTYQKIVLIFDLGTVGDGSANFTFLFDDITLN